MNLSDLHLLYDYNYWANGRLLNAAAGLSLEQYAAPAGLPYGSLRGTLLHILDAEHDWRMICQHGQFAEGLAESDFPTLDALAARWQEEEAAMRAFLGGLTDAELTRLVRYTVPEGHTRERVLWHCLWHAVNHGTQHRAEAAALLTGCGRSPGDVDFTLFLNEQARHAA